MERIKNSIGYILIILFILSAAITITINFTPLYAFDVSYFDITDITGLSKDTIMENYRILITYLNVPWSNELAMPDFPSSESGLFHFYEVKQLFLLNYVILVVSGLGSFFFLREKKKTRRTWKLLQPTRIMAVLPVVILFFIAINFDQLFVLFHELFFNNDAWLFDYRTDPIILALPQEFFMHCFILVFVLLEAGIGSVYWWAKRQIKVKY